MGAFAIPRFIALYIAYQLACDHELAHIKKIVSHSLKIVAFLATNQHLPAATLDFLNRDLPAWMTLVGKQVR